MAIYVDASTKTFFLEGKNITYAFFINPQGFAEHLYYGRRIGRDELSHTRAFGRVSTAAMIPGTDSGHTYQAFQPEISFGGTGDYREPTLLPVFPTGDRLCELLYKDHCILAQKPAISGMPSLSGEETLVLTLADRVHKLEADLYYTVYPDADVVARRIVYRNGGNESIRLQRAYSFHLGLPGYDYDLISLYGGWAAERNVERYPLHHGVSSIDSKRTVSSAVLNPFLAVVDRTATETHGEAYGISLVYSSSFVLKAEVTVQGDTLVTGGIQDHDFCWVLAPREELATPEVVLAYSAEGLGGMSRALHDAFRNHLINPRHVKKSRPLLINNWEATYFNFTTKKLTAIMDAVAGTGIDTFVLDDGWFGKRDNDRSGLGDWFVNTEKMPGGLRTVIDHAHALGMKFGLWFEPEMISEDSDLYRAHPDYAIRATNRPPCCSRHQLMLDITRQDVRDYIVESVNRIIRENGIDYVKWDYNRSVTESVSLSLPPERQQEFAHRYALGLYELCERIVNSNPSVFFEGCAGGGGRFDPAMLYYFPQIWASDDTDAEERTRIQYGTSLVYPLSAMSCHVSACPNHQTGRSSPLATRAAIAQLGATGYELDATQLTKDELADVAAQTAEYRASEHLILDGDLYRVEDPFTSNFFAMAVVSKDKNQAILTAYRSRGGTNTEIHRFRMQGLDPDKRYYVTEWGRALAGSTLMSVGFPLPFAFGDFQTVKLHFEVC